MVTYTGKSMVDTTHKWIKKKTLKTHVIADSFSVSTLKPSEVEKIVPLSFLK